MVQGTVTTIYESFMRCLAPGCGTDKGGKKGLGWFGWGSRLKSIVGPLRGQIKTAGLQSRPFKGLFLMFYKCKYNTQIKQFAV